MANTPYADLIDNVLPYLAADPSDPVTEGAIRRAAIEFCARSRIWVNFPALIPVVAYTPSYILAAPAGASVSAVLSAALDGEPLDPAAIAWLNSNVPTWRTTPSEPLYFTQIDTETVILAPVPVANSATGLVLTVALQPTEASSDIPAWIVNQYGRHIADGAISILMLMAGKPWTDLANGANRRAIFEDQIGKARNDADTGLVSAQIRSTPQH